MTPITSGTTTERIIRTSIVTLMFCGFSAYSFYDGYVGYPRENARETLRVHLGADESEPLPDISPAVTEEAAKGVSPAETVDELSARFHAAPLRYEDPATKAERVYFFGPAGHLCLDMSRGKIATVRPWARSEKHSATDLFSQKMMGIGTGIVGLIFLVHWLRVVLTRVSLSDEGLRIRGKPLVPFEAMKGFRADDYRKKGWIDLDYEMNGQPGTVRLDDYAIKQFRAIVTAICRRTGLPDPLPPPKSDEPDAAEHREPAQS